MFLASVSGQAWVSHGEDFVALFEIRHADADFLHHARHVPAGYQRKLVLDESLEKTRAHFPIERVYPGGVDADEHLVLL